MPESWVERSAAGVYVTYEDHAAEIARLTAEVTTLRARCGRLADCLREYEAWQLRVSQSVYCDGHWPEHEQRRLFFDALKECHAHNDLSPNEATDG